jgi:hypothetical protein
MVAALSIHRIYSLTNDLLCTAVELIMQPGGDAVIEVQGEETKE